MEQGFQNGSLSLEVGPRYDHSCVWELKSAVEDLARLEDLLISVLRDHHFFFRNEF